MIEAVAFDVEGYAELLTAENMPTSDLGRPNRTFLRLSKDEAVVGFVGLEFYGEAALLRSLVVLPAFKGRGHGADLVVGAIEYAKDVGVSTLWLLTNTAKPFFAHIGWQVTERSGAPVSIAESEEFTNLCPASATCM